MIRMKIVKHWILAPLPIRFECPQCECEFIA
nr:MAG TPA: Transcription elongation factor Elf1 like [Caudoviricetes sp.]